MRCHKLVRTLIDLIKIGGNYIWASWAHRIFYNFFILFSLVNSSEIQHNQLWLQKYHFFDKTDVEGDLGLAKIRCDIMSSFECPPTPPTLPEGEAAITPPPKSPPRITSDEDTSRDQNTSNNTPTNDADKNSSTRPKSPEPSCAICLGKLENMSHTNACSHKFCFVCLVEWTKVKPVCPLCKRQISSIIHNIRDGNSERYQLPPPPPRENRDIFIEAHRPDYFEVIRRFQYGGGAPDPHQVMRDILRERQEFLRMNELRRTMDR